MVDDARGPDQKVQGEDPGDLTHPTKTRRRALRSVDADLRRTVGTDRQFPAHRDRGQRVHATTSADRHHICVVGEVREIGARATTIVTDESVAIIVPNSQFISERVTNWSRPAKLTAYVLPFHVAHSSDPELVRQVLLAAATHHPDVLADPRAEVEFVEAGLAALRFQLQVWSVEHLKTPARSKAI